MSSNESGAGAGMGSSMPGSYPAPKNPPDGEDGNSFHLISFEANFIRRAGLPAQSCNALEQGINVTVGKSRAGKAGVACLALAAALVFAGAAQGAVPTITSFAPTSGSPGSSVVVSGTSFIATPASNTVKFGGSGGTAATVTAATVTSLTVTVPSGIAAASSIYVSNANGAVTSATNFTVSPTTVSSFTTKAAAGASITITGTNFHPTPASNTVLFNGSGGVAGTVTAATATSLTVTVPAAATSGKLYVTTPYGTVTTSADFFVLPTGYAAANVVTGRLTPGTGASIAIPSGAAALYLFDTTAVNQRVSFRWTNSTIGSMALEVRNPTGGYVVASTAGAGSNYIDASSLPAMGTYSIQITPDPSFSGSLTLTASVVPGDVTGTLTASPAGGSATLNLSTAGTNGRVTFTGVADHRLFIAFSASTIDGGAGVLLDVNGAPMSSTSIGRKDSFIDSVPLPSSPLSGTYTVLVDPSGVYAGSITVTVYDLGVADPAPAAIVSLPGTQAVAIASPGVNGGVSFPAVAGHKLSVKMTGSTYPVLNLRVHKPDGSQLGLASTYRAATGFIDALDVPTTGTYTLVVDPTGASTGTATFTVYDIAADAAGSFSLSSPAPASATGTATITTPGQNALITFTGTVGMRVAVAISSSTLAGGTMSILRPGGSVLKSGGLTKTSFLDSVTLDANGTHTLKLDGSDATTGTVTFTVYNVPPDAGYPTPISIVPAQTSVGGAAVATITTPGQDAWFAFNGTAGQRIALRISGSWLKSGSLDMTDPSDNPVGATVNFGTSGGWGDPVTLPLTGTYKIRAAANGTSTGNIVLTAYIVPPDVTSSVTAGGPATTVATTIPGQNMRVTFPGTAGRGVLVQLTASTIAGSFRILRADGTTILGSSSVTLAGGLIDSTTLPATETYTVLVDPKTSSVGTVSVKVVDVPADITGTLPLTGVQQVYSTVAPGQNIMLTTNVAAGQRIALSITGPAFSGSVKILRPDMTQLLSKTFSASGAFVDATAVTVTGTHSIKIDPSASGFGAVTITAYNVPADATATPLVIDGATSRLSTTVPGQNGTVTFDANSQASIRIVATTVSTGASTCCGAKVSVIGPLGTTVMLAKSVGTNGATWTLTVPSTGTYTIKMDPQASAIGGITFKVQSNV